MKYLVLPEQQGEERLLSFYLAMEEYAARHIDEQDLFFTWQVEPSVIFGRNQLIDNEVNIAYCREHGIRMFQRKSGGGCVYADMGNVMLSYVTKEENANIAFNTFINMVLLVLRRVGIEAVGSSHNDVLIGDRKVSGTACYKLPERCIVHSTLLYDADMENMVHAITPGPEKLQSKGIQSVRQRITLLKDYTSISVSELRALIRQTLCTGEVMLTSADVAAIGRLEAESYSGYE